MLHCHQAGAHNGTLDGGSAVEFFKQSKLKKKILQEVRPRIVFLLSIHNLHINSVVE